MILQARIESGLISAVITQTDRGFIFLFQATVPSKDVGRPLFGPPQRFCAALHGLTARS